VLKDLNAKEVPHKALAETRLSPGHADERGDINRKAIASSLSPYTKSQPQFSTVVAGLDG
jgi:hypothetical protein